MNRQVPVPGATIAPRVPSASPTGFQPMSAKPMSAKPMSGKPIPGSPTVAASSGTAVMRPAGGRRRGRKSRGKGTHQPAQMRKLVLVDVESLMSALDTRARLAPQQSVADAARKIAADVGVDASGVERLLKLGHFDFGAPDGLSAPVATYADASPAERLALPIGRLRRVDRMKLAREMYRFWRQGVGSAVGAFA